jgi:hypothetical protein
MTTFALVLRNHPYRHHRAGAERRDPVIHLQSLPLYGLPGHAQQ